MDIIFPLLYVYLYWTNDVSLVSMLEEAVSSIDADARNEHFYQCQQEPMQSPEHANIQFFSNFALFLVSPTISMIAESHQVCCLP